MLSTYAAELARRLQGDGDGETDVVVHSLCPGAVNSRIAREAPAWSQPLLGLVFRLFFQTPAEAAKPVEVLCCSADMGRRTGVYLHLMQEKPLASAAADVANGRKLWQASEALLERLRSRSGSI